MDQKRELSSIDLAALVTELRAYEGSKVDKAYLYDDSLVRLRMRDFDRGRVELLLEVGDPKRLHAADPETVPDAPGRPPNFAMMLRNRISGADFAGIEQYEYDRIVTLRFERPDGVTLVIAELFGDGNVIVCNADYEIIDCLDTVRLSSRTVVPGAQYEYPQSRFDPLTASEDAFYRQMEGSDTDIVRTLATQLNFGGLWAEELCSRADVEKTKPIADASDSEYAALFRVLTDLRSTLADGAFEPRVYYEDDAPVDVTPIALREYGALETERFDSFNAALDSYFLGLDEAETATGTEPERPDFEAEIEKFERIIEQQQGAIEDFETEANQERRKAELLYKRYGLVDEVLSAIQNARADDLPWETIRERFEEGTERDIPAAKAVQSVDGSQGTVTLDLAEATVTLDTTIGVEKNADQLYQDAKRIEEKREGALEAIEETREQLAAVQQRRETWEAGDDDTEEETEETTPEQWLSEPSIPVRRDEKWYERFRWFHTSDGFLVIGGRSADQNEELVKKYMESGDLFFHTQAHGAPATILKATGPSEAAKDVEIPEQSREEAAQFAVSYSSIWKDGHYSGDVYMATPDQVTKTPESGEFIEKGSFVIRGERTYYRDTAVGVSVGITCDPQTRVVGGPSAPIEAQTVTNVELEPGRYAQNDIAKLVYREFRDRFEDEAFVRKVASPDLIQEFCPAGGSRIHEE
ncbi:ribosome rescue protein RqcH [Halocatena pleomorpha]|uniref:Archaeal Rqc2 homolog aRqcH n=1 Tax=Halocatena pleomorpha TaxID=1785090 RepID=A0A3P3RJI1_9EURY|nr:ribosome rescue protein RqcH [Halocatena pleomorpha]RRJ32969.1 fibronectin-binding domain-containing protein [Halocatena pleomorpha]